MISTVKLTDNKAIIAYLAEKFPKCFILSGEAKPLKIGLFQDLAQRLSEDDKVSKTQLRGAIRHYTTSWRYLKCIKQGAKRVDLDGNLGDELSEEHIEHAKTTLAESQQKAKKREIEKSASQAKNKPAKPSSRAARAKVPSKSTSKKSSTPKVLEGEKITDVAALKVNQQVIVALGKAPMNGTIVDIAKSDIKVQLVSGMVVKVKPEHLLAKS